MMINKTGTIPSTLYRKAHGVLLVYSVTDRLSFNNIRLFRSEVGKYCEDKVVLFMVGNKADLDEREVTRKEGEELAADLNMKYFETSAKYGEGLDVFTELAKDIMSRGLPAPKINERESTVDLQTPAINQSKKCC